MSGMNPAVSRSVVLGFLACITSAHPATAFDFAFIGDVPYIDKDSLRFNCLQERIDAECGVRPPRWRHQIGDRYMLRCGALAETRLVRSLRGALYPRTR